MNLGIRRRVGALKSSISANRTFRFLLVIALVVMTANRLPAPISEVPESPTPAPEQSAKPKPKPTIKPKVTSESSESSIKRQTPSPQPKSQATPQRNLFNGTWVGTIRRGIFGNIDCTFIISAAGTSVVDKSRLGSFTWRATCDGQRMQWRGGAMDANNCSWTFTPNADGETALVTESVLFVANSSAVFRKTSP